MMSPYKVSLFFSRKPAGHTSQHLRNIKGLNIANLTLRHLFVSGDYDVFVEV